MISKRILNIEESSTLAMAKKSRDLISKGKKIINLSLGEPDFNTPSFIQQAAKKAIDQNYSKYTPVPGYNELQEVISQKLIFSEILTALTIQKIGGNFVCKIYIQQNMVK